MLRVLLQVLGLCLRGFALQGKFSNLRRNYSSIWRQMTDKQDVIKDPQVRLGCSLAHARNSCWLPAAKRHPRSRLASCGVF